LSNIVSQNPLLRNEPPIKINPGIWPFVYCLLLLSISSIFAQKKPAYVSGKVLDENEKPLSNVSVVILGQQKGIGTSDSGTFRLKVTADRAFAIVFSYTGFKSQQKNFY
jgi:hypothetical protein